MRIRKEVDVNKENRDKIFKIIMVELLNDDITIGGYLGKKLKEITLDYGILYNILDENLDYLKYKTSSMTHRIGKVNYIFKVLESHIKQ